MLTSKSALIDASAQEIHHHSMLQAIIQNIIDIIKLEKQYQVFCSFFLFNKAMIKTIHSKVKGSIHIYINHSEYVMLSNLILCIIR